MSELFFSEVLSDAQKKYLAKKAKYGESWRGMSYISLRNRFDEEREEFEFACSTGEAYDELLDVINVAVMLAENLASQIKRRSKSDSIGLDDSIGGKK